MSNENKTDNEITDIDFDLPVLDGPKAKPRIHMAPGESACTSCEG